MVTVSDDKAAVVDGPRQERAGTGEDASGAAAEAWRTLWPLMDLVTPMALRVAATLRLADALPADGDGMPVGKLAVRAGADQDALARMLRYLAAHGVFAEPSPGVFAVNGTAALLRSDDPAGIRIWLDLDSCGRLPAQWRDP